MGLYAHGDTISAQNDHRKQLCHQSCYACRPLTKKSACIEHLLIAKICSPICWTGSMGQSEAKVLREKQNECRKKCVGRKIK